MNRTPWMEDFQKNLSDLLAKSPAADVERNVRAMMTQAFSKLDLVTREEFDVQAELLSRTRAKLDALSARLDAIEARANASAAGGAMAGGATAGTTGTAAAAATAATTASSNKSASSPSGPATESGATGSAI